MLQKLSLPLDGWGVLLVGEFSVKTCAELMQALQDHGAVLASSLTENCTHVVIGSIDVEKSLAHVKARSSLPVVRERAMWAIINGDADDVRFTKPGSSPPPTAAPSASLDEKVLCAFHALCAKGKRLVTLAQVEMQLADTCADDFLDVAWNENLTRAIDKALETGSIVKDGYMYALKDNETLYVNACAPSAADGLSHTPASEASSILLQDSSIILNSVDAEWKGLSWVRQESSIGGVSCFVCDSDIKIGQVMVQLRDECLFQIIEERRQNYENAMRYADHEPFPQFANVRRKDFSVHESCLTEADKICKIEFDMDWSAIKPELDNYWIVPSPKLNTSVQMIPEPSIRTPERAVDGNEKHEAEQEVWLNRSREMSLGMRKERESDARDASQNDSIVFHSTSVLPRSYASRLPLLKKSVRNNIELRNTAVLQRASNSSKLIPPSRGRPGLIAKRQRSTNLRAAPTATSIPTTRKPRKRIIYRPNPPSTIEPWSADKEGKVGEKGEWRGLKRMSSRESKQGRATCVGCFRTIRKGEIEVKMKNDSMYYQLEDLKTEMMEIWGKKQIPGLPSLFKGNIVVIHDECEEIAEEKCERRFHQEWAKLRDKVNQKTEEARSKGELKGSDDEVNEMSSKPLGIRTAQQGISVRPRHNLVRPRRRPGLGAYPQRQSVRQLISGSESAKPSTTGTEGPQ